MAVNCSPFGPKPQFVDATGAPAVGYQLFFYVAGSVNTKQNTYRSSTGLSANTNPIVLNSLGEPANEIWFTAGLSYKAVLALPTDTDPPTSPVWTIDNLYGINDVTVSQSQWVAGPPPTYISASSFSLAGDQTSNFTVGRRLQLTDGIGTKYATITSASYDGISLTTVVVTVDGGGSLSNPVSAVSYGLLSPTNISIPRFIQAGTSITITYDTSGRPVITSTAPTGMQSITGTVNANALTAGYTGGTLDFRSATLATGTATTLIVPALSLVVSSGSTLGTSNGLPARLWLAVINNAGTPELAIINTQLGNGQIAAINESTLISTTAEGGAGAADSAGVWYSTTARASVPFRLVGYIESTQATAGTWATAPSVLQGMSYGVKKPGDIIQYQRFSTTAVVSGATAMFFDNTIPQITEGDEYASKAVVPTSAINSLLIDADLCFAPNGAGVAMIALFQDATANALRGRAQSVTGGNAIQLPVHHEMQAGTSASTTFRVRAGINGASTNSINAQTGGGAVGLFGGTAESWMTITEVMA